MLTEREPVPDRLDAGRRLRVGVFREVPQQRLLERRDVRPPGHEAQEAVRQVVLSRGEAAERIRRAEPLQLRVPRPGKQHLVQLAPGMRSLHPYPPAYALRYA